MNRAIAWFAENHVAANLLMMLLVVGGLLAIPTLRQEVFPEINLDVVTVSVVYPGAAPVEIEEGICIRIEEELQGLQGIKRVSSTAAEGACLVSVELLAGEELALGPVEEVVTYHDPCDLGRKSEVYDAPREVLGLIPGLDFQEMAACRENALCCGGGGDVEISDRTVSHGVAGTRVGQAAATGAKYVLSSCQQCKRTLQEGARQNKIRVRAMDIVELVWQSVNAAGAEE